MRNGVYILAGLAFTSILGAGAYEHLVIWPSAFAAPPASLNMFQGDYAVSGASFWALIHPITLLLLGIALALHWRTPRRRHLLVTIAGYLIILVVTAIYFVPELMAIIATDFADSVDAGLVARGETWIVSSWARLVMIMGLASYLWWGLAQPVHVQEKPRGGEAPPAG